MPEQKRQIAYKLRIEDILKGEYVVEEGWTPNYIDLEGKKVSRVNIIATLVEKGNVILIDDGTGRISIREFENNLFEDKNIGDIILVIGRPREYGDERYILPEIAKKVNDHKWIMVRKLELEKEKPIKTEENVTEKEIEEEPIQLSEMSKIEEKKEIYEEAIDTEKEVPKIIGYIKKNDEGEGVEVHNVFTTEEDKKQIEVLLKEGEIFEVRPGKYKVLE